MQSIQTICEASFMMKMMVMVTLIKIAITY